MEPLLSTFLFPGAVKLRERPLWEGVKSMPVQAICDARNEGLDIFIVARTDSLIFGWEEAISRAKEFVPIIANIIKGGKTENLSAKCLAELGFCAVTYPWTLIASKLKSIRETLEKLKGSMTIDAPPTILSYPDVCAGVGLNRYWEREEKYKFDKFQ
jgi:2-methylisocitrate lyase-like PEP mutase family enzyme